MDFFQKPIDPVPEHPSNHLTFSSPDPHSLPAMHDSITSLMNMADKMEDLLPPDISLHITSPHTSPSQTTTTKLPDHPHTFHDCLSSVTGASFKTEPKPISLSLPSDATLHETLLPSAHPATHPPAHPHTQLDLSAATLPYSGGVTDVSGPLSIPSYPPHVKKQLSLSTRPATVADTSSGNAKSFHTPVFENASFLAAENSSPCAVRDVSALRPTFVDTLPRTGITKARKTTRKPKTYSKPVASRFCHICSRMPRRGQGSATCRRMAEGFCRKIVCEQCLREQGWNYEDIAKNPGAWLCPHCADICPPRSQCHIYNRINARRKRAGTSKNGGTSVAAALASSDLLLGPYGHLFNGASQGAHILQPPPNFRLNLPPQYSQQ